MTQSTHSLDNAIMLSSQGQSGSLISLREILSQNRFYYALNEAELLDQISFGTLPSL